MHLHWLHGVVIFLQQSYLGGWKFDQCPALLHSHIDGLSVQTESCVGEVVHCGLLSEGIAVKALEEIDVCVGAASVVLCVADPVTWHPCLM